MTWMCLNDDLMMGLEHLEDPLYYNPSMGTSVSVSNFMENQQKDAEIFWSGFKLWTDDLPTSLSLLR